MGTVLAGLALLSAGAVLAAPRPVALTGGLLLALVLPGASIARLLFPGRTLAVAEWTMLVPALSLATLALGGLGLYAVGVGLDRNAWLLLTAGVALVAAVAGQVRARRRSGLDGARFASGGARFAEGGRSRFAEGGRSPSAEGGVRLGRRTPLWAVKLDPVVGHAAPTAGTVPAGAVPDGPRAGRMTARRAALRLLPLAVAAALLGGATWYSVRGVERAPATPFTSLELVPAFATEAPGRTRTVSVGLHCEEHEVTDYRVRIRGASRFELTLRTRLRPGESWARQARVPAAGRVTVDLFRGGSTTAYRSVFLESAR